MLLSQKQLQTTQDLLAAADREFENGEAVLGSEHLWAAITHTVKATAAAKGLAYDADDLFPTLEQLASDDKLLCEILLTSFMAAQGHPGLFSAGYLRFDAGDTHRVRRLAHEFVDALQELAA